MEVNMIVLLGVFAVAAGLLLLFLVVGRAGAAARHARATEGHSSYAPWIDGGAAAYGGDGGSDCSPSSGADCSGAADGGGGGGGGGD
jgi:hypothetical protein